MIPGIIFLLIVFALALSRAVFVSRKNKVKEALQRVHEALWARHSKIPLLLSLIVPIDATQKAVFAQLLALREELSAEHISWSKRIELEKKVTHLIGEILATGQSDQSVSKKPLFLAHHKELVAANAALQTQIVNYNTELNGFIHGNRVPWMKLWSDILIRHSFPPLPEA